MVSLRSVSLIKIDRIAHIFNLAMTEVLRQHDVISINRH
ncbi:hypothetical protein D1AOALGA4SA_11077 [Olavius algarvensis Delta 1 endosymbiont]|nr:hypothetical protein D1AOALGA4SA_11077 [Olavius algarvensis Delta 1 endosymbiont]